MTTLKDILNSFASDVQEIVEAHNEDEDIETLDDKIEDLIERYVGK